MHLSTATWLTAPEGRTHLADVRARLQRGEDALRIGTDLRAGGLDADRAAALTAVAAASLRAGTDLLGPPDALEQASHPLVSAWRAARFGGAGRVVDLCAGVGGDAAAIAHHSEVVAVDRDAVRVAFLRANAPAARAIVGDALRPPVRLGAPVHADPSRRRGTRRARRLADYDPPVGALVDATEAAPGRAIVLAPGVDLDDPDLPAGELEFVQVGEQLTEAVVWTGNLAGEGQATATLLPSGTTRTRHGEPVPLPVGAIGETLLEVAPAAVRARLHDELGAEVGARRLATHRALLTVDGGAPASPWWRAREVEAVLSTRARDIRAWLRTADDVPLEIATAGLPVEPEALWRELGRPPRGPVGRRLLLARLDDRAVTLVLRDRDGGPDPSDLRRSVPPRS